MQKLSSGREIGPENGKRLTGESARFGPVKLSDMGARLEGVQAVETAKKKAVERIKRLAVGSKKEGDK